MNIENLKIGEIIVSSEPIRVRTILGSCVSVCLFSTEFHIGGINHFSLPVIDKKITGLEKLKYAESSIFELINQLQLINKDVKNSLKAKIVGGAGDIGRANIKEAKKILQQLKIEIIGEDIGGDFGREVLFDTHSGRLQVANFENKFIPQKLPAFIDDQKKKIKVLIVDDSKIICEILSKILKSDESFEIIGTAFNPKEAEKIIKMNRPDVITLDIFMPEVTGVEWLEKFLPNNPIPTVMVTSLELKDGNEVFRALEFGAIDYIQKPTLNEIYEAKSIICEKIKNASKAKVKIFSKRSSSLQFKGKYKNDQIILIGASTGGTEALKSLLTMLPAEIPPILIVQHIPPVFSTAFAMRLNEICKFEVREAKDLDEIKPGLALIAPGGMQMKLIRNQGKLVVRINQDAPVNRHRPSVDYLFFSAAEVLKGDCIGIILTGMGADGAKGLLKLKNELGAFTFAQDEESSVVYGMPKAAYELGAVSKVVSLERLPDELMDKLKI